ncbi:cell division protein FtsQ/DivIB [Sporosarcina sp. G11-34]|uniref:cell division protein FtsQ/DivIB n=1 Tax=Sporosarcina sp. G11-34 TaxID=2849605 RepID=UPI0022A99DB8|nr:FtsQ-type POTRA domain-containing protein [Sporosarcina sp. G11-34]MCZ2258870.1 FtsQ-type POTRA domain-containing protein [Sporosarcina sp. G11-34]
MKKVIDIEERIPSMREKRRKKTNKKFLFVFLIFIVALLAILYFQSPLSRIKEIAVSGAILKNSEYYEEKSGLVVDNPLWGFRTTSAEDLLMKQELVQKASISRKWPNKVKIEIVEWKTIAYLEDRGLYNLLMENGEVFPGDALLLESDIPVLNNFGSAKVIKQVSAQLLKLDSDVYHLISEIVFTGTEEDPEKLTIYMDDGYEVRAILSTLSEKMDYYPDVTAQLNGLEKGVIDMEVGTYFTPYSKIYGLSKEDDEVVEEE